MRCVVCGDNADASVGKCLTQHELVDRCLDCRVHLDTSTQTFVVELSEEQVAYAGFGGDISLSPTLSKGRGS
jgi:hypothetical protein